MVLTDEAKAAYSTRTNSQQVGLVEIIYYTDPLCCWSWAFEPQWRRLLYDYEGQITYRYCMGGLLPSWNNYTDSVNNVTRPIQMGPVWMHAKQLSGMAIEHNVWMTDPPSSSYTACIAVKSAALQSPQAEELYLRLMREAIMLKGKNIAKQEVQWQLAEEVAGLVPGFSVNRFKEDMKNDNGLEAFRADLQEVQRHSINRFPSLVIRHHSNRAILVAGYRSYDVLVGAIQQLVPLVKTNPEPVAEHYKQRWPFATERELAELQ